MKKIISTVTQINILNIGNKAHSIGDQEALFTNTTVSEINCRKLFYLKKPLHRLALFIALTLTL